MKKIITLMALVIFTFSTIFAAGNNISKNDISKDALANFSAAFSKATNVKWEKANTYFSAFFQLDGKSLQALFSIEGDLIAVSQNILSTELPADLRAPLPAAFSACWITDLVKYDIAGESRYFVTLENGSEKVILENIGSYNWSVLKRSDK